MGIFTASARKADHLIIREDIRAEQSGCHASRGQLSWPPSSEVQRVLGELPIHTRIVDGYPQAQLDSNYSLDSDLDFDLEIEFPDNQLRNLSTALDTLCAADESLKIEYEYSPSKQLLSIHIPMAEREHGHIVGSLGEQITIGRFSARAVLAEDPENGGQLAAVLARVRPASDARIRSTSLDWCKHPDLSYTYDLKTPPTFNVEVAVTQSRQDLESKARGYFANTRRVQTVLLIDTSGRSLEWGDAKIMCRAPGAAGVDQAVDVMPWTRFFGPGARQDGDVAIYLSDLVCPGTPLPTTYVRPTSAQHVGHRYVCFCLSIFLFLHTPPGPVPSQSYSLLGFYSDSFLL